MECRRHCGYHYRKWKECPAGGRAYFITLEGEKLGVTKKAGVLTISDSKGNTAVIQETDFYHKNGFFHMVEGFAFDTKVSQ